MFDEACRGRRAIATLNVTIGGGGAGGTPGGGAGGQSRQRMAAPRAAQRAWSRTGISVIGTGGPGGGASSVNATGTAVTTFNYGASAAIRRIESDHLGARRGRSIRRNRRRRDDAAAAAAAAAADRHQPRTAAAAGGAGSGSSTGGEPAALAHPDRAPGLSACQPQQIRAAAAAAAAGGRQAPAQAARAATAARDCVSIVWLP